MKARVLSYGFKPVVVFSLCAVLIVLAGCGSGVSSLGGTVVGTWKIVKTAVTGAVSYANPEDTSTANGIDTGGQVAEQWTITNENGQYKLMVTDIYGQTYGPIPGQASSTGVIFQAQYQDPRIVAYGVPTQSTVTIDARLSSNGLWGTEQITTLVGNGLNSVLPTTESWTFRGTP